jgi:hypothetical protein
MPCSIVTTSAVKLDGGKIEWAVKTDAVFELSGEHYVRFDVRNQSLIRLVCEGVVEVKGKKNLSLVNCEGLKEIIKIRNERQRDELDAAAAAPAAAALFGAVQPLAKKPRRSMAAMRALRNAPEAIDIVLPGFDGTPPMNTFVLRPIRSNDELVVFFHPNVIEHLVLYIRSRGLNAEDLVDKRAYRQSGYAGVWCVGNHFYVKGVKGAQRKFYTSVADAVAAKDALADEEGGADGIVAEEEEAAESHEHDAVHVEDAGEELNEDDSSNTSTSSSSSSSSKTSES